MTLPYQKLKEMITGTSPMILSSVGIRDEHIQPASLDMTLGRRVYRVSSSILPRKDETIAELLEKYTLYSFELKEHTILEKNASYVIPLQESVELPDEIFAVASPKSSIGRVDVFVRLLVDGTPQFDYVPQGYKGPIYIEVIPLSFVVSVSPGLSLNQLRFKTDESHQLSTIDLKLAHSHYGLVFDPYTHEPIPPSILNVHNNSLALTVDLKNRDIIGWRSKPSTIVVDLSQRESLDAEKCWEPIPRQESEELILVPNSFYLLASVERVRVPIAYSCEMAAYDVSSGELRSHYAGFFDPGFGYGVDGSVPGATAVLEVRPHSVPFRITHGQVICKMIYEKLSELPEKVYSQGAGSYYTDLGPKLSKYFKNAW
ncbi:MAG TPA: 2'-deoxycytidine 5'-triphosphate deaminase [Patescibacteria group bacterium]|nr:2'-deoxycytidine 5'-triphosphate deaminase [Patescibacteria group bacterium]